MTLPQQRRLAMPCYIVAVALMVLPVFDQVMHLLPTLKLHDARWRYGALGLVSNMLLLPLLGMTLAFALSAIFEHRTWQRVLGVVAALGIALVVVAMGVFALDAIEVRSLMRTEMLSSWSVATLTAAGKYLLAVVALTGFARAGFAAPAASKAPAIRREDGLVVGRTSRPPLDRPEPKPTAAT